MQFMADNLAWQVLGQTAAAMERPLFGRLFGFELLLPVKLPSLLLQRLQVVFIKK